jgi:hypothetical protein
MTLKSILTSSAMLGLAVAPLAAHAGTRVSSISPSAVGQSALSDGGSRGTVTVRKENGIAQAPLLLLIAAGIGGTVLVTKAIVEDNNKSRGAS